VLDRLRELRGHAGGVLEHLLRRGGGSRFGSGPVLANIVGSRRWFMLY
jgi:hypothetical protein